MSENGGYPRDEESESKINNYEAGSEQEEKESIEAAKHPFSEPWEESDLMLVVEEETFHVHRQIMSIHSPVFKAMLKSVGIKEDIATEIPLPGKKADEFLDFLKILYLKEKEGIELNKMGHILRLADEYKVEGVHDFCSKMLRDLPKSEVNAVKVFFLSTQTLMAREDDRLEPVRSQCKTIVKDMDLVDIQGSGVLKKLNKDACESLLVERIKGLETHVTQVYPQFVGLAEYCLHLGLNSLPGMVKCPEHFINPKVDTALPERIVSCSYCKKMINQLVQLSLESEGHEHVYGGEHHFNSDLISILKNFTTVMRSLQRKTSLGAAQNLLIAGTSPFEAKTLATSPLCDSKAFTETVKSGSVGLPSPAATPGIQALPSPIVGNEAYQSSEVQFGNVAPEPPTTHVGTSLFGSSTERTCGTGSSLFGSTASTGTSGTGSSLFGSTASTGTSGTGSSLFGSTASTGLSGTGSSLFGSTAITETVGIGNFRQQSFSSTSASKANSGFLPLNSRGKGKRT